MLFSIKPEEGAVLPEQTELRLSEFLLAADGGRNEKLMGKITSNMFILSIKAKKKNLLDWESKRSSLHKEAADFVVVADGWRDGKNGFQHGMNPFREEDWLDAAQ